MGDERFKHEVEVDGEAVIVNVLSYAHIFVPGDKTNGFRSVQLPMTPQVIPASGETVFRMDLTEVSETIARLKAEGKWDAAAD
jgi:hypothetical protein